MNKKFLSALICGFGAAIPTAIQSMQGVACCLLVPFASGFAIFIYKKSQPDLLKINTGTGILIGVLTAIVAAFFASSFDVIITYITKSSEIISTLPQAEKLVKDMNLGTAADESLKILHKITDEIHTKGFSFYYTFLITITNFITYPISGIIGGIVGTAIINKRKQIF